ncbi:MAG: CBS domain-containing protein [Halieaceae bacterium]|jgi:CBS domain-containing protein|nr:CBS domain-containing protein [Halieaceae bacterium]
MRSIKTLLEIKGGQAWSIAPQATVYDALQLMSDKDVGALLVVEHGKLVGIFTERDYARKLILKGRFSKDTAVRDLMTPDVLYIEPTNTIDDCMMLMTKNRIRHLPVMESGELVGIVTIGDVVKQIISDQESTIGHLEQYITGGY